MTHNMKIKYPFYISENPFIYSLFHTVGFVSHSVKYVSHTVVFVFHSVKQRICHSKMTNNSLSFIPSLQSPLKNTQKMPDAHSKSIRHSPRKYK